MTLLDEQGALGWAAQKDDFGPIGLSIYNWFCLTLDTCGILCNFTCTCYQHTFDSGVQRRIKTWKGDLCVLLSSGDTSCWILGPTWSDCTHNWEVARFTSGVPSSHNWLISKRNKFLWLMVTFKFLLSTLLHIVPCSVSMTAWTVLRRKLLERRNGVLPSTTAIWNHDPCNGKSNAWRLGNVWWLPNLNTRWQWVLLTCWRTSSGSLDKSSDTWLLPITVCEAPRSTTPMVPVDAK